MTAARVNGRLGVLGAGALLALLPLVLSSYSQYVVNIMVVYAIIALGLDLLIGRTYQLSFGAAATYGVGAYVTAILSVTYHWPVVAAAVAACALSGLAGLVFALPAVRVRDIYLAIATLGLVLVFVQVWLNWVSVTHGGSGFVVPNAHVGRLSLTNDRAFYAVAVVVFLICLGLSEALLRSKAGRAFAAIKHNELAASFAGVNTAYYKALVFAVSSAFGGIAGALYVCYVGYVAPESFDASLAITFVSMVVIGGLGSRLGAVVGAVYVVGIPELLRVLGIGNVSVFVYGLSLVVVLLVFPGGIASALRLPLAALRAARGERQGVATVAGRQPS